MSLDYRNIIKRVHLYALVAEEYKEEIDHVRVFNQIEERFGFNHCVIYVKFELKKSSKKEIEISRTLTSTFFRNGQEEKFSFRLGNQPPIDERSHSNEKEEIHFNYICNLLKWFLDEKQIEVKFDLFLNERRAIFLERKIEKEYEEKSFKIEEAMSSVNLEAGDIIAFKNYSWEQIQIGRIEKITPLSNASKKASIETVSLLNNFKPGAKRSKIESDQVYAVIKPDKIKNWISKAELILSVVEGKDQASFLWRRMKELW